MTRRGKCRCLSVSRAVVCNLEIGHTGPHAVMSPRRGALHVWPRTIGDAPARASVSIETLLEHLNNWIDYARLLVDADVLAPIEEAEHTIRARYCLAPAAHDQGFAAPALEPVRDRREPPPGEKRGSR